ncbi:MULTISPECIES: hypothetical protein [unclassified Streptomyces]|uniref:hypothetical protein n=1 Tax=unclassified Streptomyces TaxID=2593676 RepID=UPI0033ACBD15
MYDVSDWTTVQSDVGADWTAKTPPRTASPADARQNGEPVVCVRGSGFNDAQRPFTPDQCLGVVNRLRT